jgi:hypothetical protein
MSRLTTASRLLLAPSQTEELTKRDSHVTQRYCITIVCIAVVPPPLTPSVSSLTIFVQLGLSVKLAARDDIWYAHNACWCIMQFECRVHQVWYEQDARARKTEDAVCVSRETPRISSNTLPDLLLLFRHLEDGLGGRDRNKVEA